jgi:nucleotide-binding universal stress UspA family protein
MEEAMFRYILVEATGRETDMPVFRTALTLARIHAAHIAFLHVQPDVRKLAIPVGSAEYGAGAGVAEFIAWLEQEALTRHDKAKEAVQDFCVRQAITMSTTPLDASPSAEWRVEHGEEAHWVAVHGRVADLTLLGCVREHGRVSMDVVDAALMETGRPILILPALPPAQIGQTVAIAWKDTAEASSAIAAALPLLRMAQQVIILSVVEDTRTDAAACERLRHALAWHNRATTVQCLTASGGEPADILLKAAAEFGADLLVMGGYGHSRMREVVLGGFTRRVLQAAELPVLMAR